MDGRIAAPQSVSAPPPPPPPPPSPLRPVYPSAPAGCIVNIVVVFLVLFLFFGFRIRGSPRSCRRPPAMRSSRPPPARPLRPVPRPRRFGARGPAAGRGPSRRDSTRRAGGGERRTPGQAGRARLPPP